MECFSGIGLGSAYRRHYTGRIQFEDGGCRAAVNANPYLVNQLVVPGNAAQDDFAADLIRSRSRWHCVAAYL